MGGQSYGKGSGWVGSACLRGPPRSRASSACIVPAGAPELLEEKHDAQGRAGMSCKAILATEPSKTCVTSARRSQRAGRGRSACYKLQLRPHLRLAFGDRTRNGNGASSYLCCTCPLLVPAVPPVCLWLSKYGPRFLLLSSWLRAPSRSSPRLGGRGAGRAPLLQRLRPPRTIQLKRSRLTVRGARRPSWAADYRRRRRPLLSHPPEQWQDPRPRRPGPAAGPGCAPPAARPLAAACLVRRSAQSGRRAPQSPRRTQAVAEPRQHWLVEPPPRQAPVQIGQARQGPSGVGKGRLGKGCSRCTLGG